RRLQRLSMLIAACSYHAYAQPRVPVPPRTSDLGLEEGDECVTYILHCLCSQIAIKKFLFGTYNIYSSIITHSSLL
ncbi:MAG: hypothetical protein ACYTFK_13945, partial [Planctomycetota bacterium]